MRIKEVLRLFGGLGCPGLPWALFLFVVLAGPLFADKLSASPLLYKEGQMIVKLKPENTGGTLAVRKDFLRASGLTPLKRFNSGAELVALPEGSDVLQTAARLNENPAVEYAEPNYIIRAAYTPNDSYFDLQLNMTITSTDRAWDVINESPDVIVAVLDTGADYTHPDLAGNIWTNPLEALNGIDDDSNGYVDDIRGWNWRAGNNDPYDDTGDGHGTHVAGTIAARGDNNFAVAGMTWNVKLMVLKILGSYGEGTTADEILAIDYAVEHGARIINASYTYPVICEPVPPSEAEQEAIERARLKGVLFVAAAGNGGCDNSETPFYPASYPLDNILSVGASNISDAVMYTSNRGYETVHVFAPGDSVLSLYPGGNLKYLSGTSMASPQAAGLAALLLARRPSYSALDVREIIMASADRKSTFKGLVLSGGRMNSYKAITAEKPWPYPPLGPTGLEASSGADSSVTVTYLDNSSNEQGYELYRAQDGGQSTRVLTSEADTLSITDTTALDGRRYTYTVRSYNSHGYSDFSQGSEVTTALMVPSGLTLRSGSRTSVELSWTDNSESESGYIVERKNESGDFVEIDRTGANSTGYTEYSLIEGQSYTYRVSAYNSLMTSEAGGQASIIAGSGAGSGGGGGCFVATAAFGSYNHPVVRILRQLRDRRLKNSLPGRKFISAYYAYGPWAARRIQKSTYLRASSIEALLPLAASSGFLMKYSALAAMLLYLAFVAVVMAYPSGRGSRPPAGQRRL